MTRSTLLMTVQGDEAEPVVVKVDENEATLIRDDGEIVVFNLSELRAALSLDRQPLVAEPRSRLLDSAGGSDLEARR